MYLKYVYFFKTRTAFSYEIVINLKKSYFDVFKSWWSAFLIWLLCLFNRYLFNNLLGMKGKPEKKLKALWKRFGSSFFVLGFGRAGCLFTECFPFLFIGGFKSVRWDSCLVLEKIAHSPMDLNITGTKESLSSFLICTVSRILLKISHSCLSF